MEIEMETRSGCIIEGCCGACFEAFLQSGYDFENPYDKNHGILGSILRPPISEKKG